MMVRRVFCLLLVLQLLLVQGLLCRRCAGECGRAPRAAGRPHVHLSRSGPDERARPRCPCCQRRLERRGEKQAGRTVAQLRGQNDQADGRDDVLYLPVTLLTGERPQAQQRTADVSSDVLALPADATAAGLPDGPPPAPWSPPPLSPPGRPLYLRTLRLLV